MLILDADQVRAALAFDRLVPALRRAFAEGAEVPLRHTHKVQSRGAQGTILIMPAWNAAGYLGIKTINIYPDNGRLGLPGLHATYALYDASTGVPLAHLDGNEITARRTAGASALAADYLARADAAHLLVVGAGRIAGMLPDAYAAVRPLRRVSIWNRRAEGAQALANTLRERDWDAVAVTDLQAAVGAADIVTCATLSTQPLIRGAWLRPGVHLDLIGSFTPDMCETDPACFDGNAVFVDTDEALAKAGDLLAAKAAGTFADDRVLARLDQLCRGERPGRRSAGEVTVFKSVGTALEDLTAACLAYESAAGGRGAQASA